MAKMRQFSSYSASTRAKIYALTYITGGFRWRIEDREDDPHMLLSWTGTGILKGWIALNQCNDQHGNYVEALIYVDPRFRQQGVGTDLLKRAIGQAYNIPDLDTNNRDIHVYPWESRSKALYNSEIAKALPILHSTEY